MPKGTNSEMRTCKKNNCHWPAAAVMTYSYRTSEVFLNDVGEPHPSCYDFCEHHANDLTIPKGWALRDERQPKEVIKELSVKEIEEKANRLRPEVQRVKTPVALSGATYQSDRYQSLYESLNTMSVMGSLFDDSVPSGVQGIPGVADLLDDADFGHNLLESTAIHTDSAVNTNIYREREETNNQANMLLRSVYEENTAPSPMGRLGSTIETSSLSRKTNTPISQAEAEIVYPDEFKDLG